MQKQNEKNMTFRNGDVCVKCHRTQTVYVSNNLLSLYMSYDIELQNRIHVGFVLGWSSHKPDENYDFGEFILFLGLISINIKYKKDEV